MPSKARGYYAGFRFPPNRIKKMMQEDEEVGYITHFDGTRFLGTRIWEDFIIHFAQRDLT